MQRTILKITVVCLILGFIFTKIIISRLNTQISTLEKRNQELSGQLLICDMNLKQANTKINLANKLNDDNMKIIAKYNSLKRKEYKNADDTNFNKLHSLDLLLESKSIISTTNTTNSSSRSDAN